MDYDPTDQFSLNFSLVKKKIRNELSMPSLSWGSTSLLFWHWEDLAAPSQFLCPSTGINHFVNKPWFFSYWRKAGKFYVEMFIANQRATLWTHFTNMNLD
jgi:hypothetical protein